MHRRTDWRRKRTHKQQQLAYGLITTAIKLAVKLTIKLKT